MIKVEEGQPLPDFDLPAAIPGESGMTGSTLSRADLRGKPFVLFVYPKDATSGCTVEACEFREQYSAFQQLGVEVLGLSRDTLSSHRRFIENQQLPYPLLADKEQIVVRGWGLLKDATMYGKPVTKVQRTTFLVDEAGVVRRIFTDVQPLGHAAAVLEAAREIVALR